MRTITKIKTDNARIVLSPWFLDYYTPIGYVTAQAAISRWVEVCVTDACATYTPEFLWLFEGVTCVDLVKIYEFLKQTLNGPPWPVFKLVREAFTSLERIVKKHCRRF